MQHYAFTVAVAVCICTAIAFGSGPADQWEFRYLGKAPDSTNWLDIAYDAYDTAYIVGSAGRVHIGGLEGWATETLPIQNTDHPGLMADDAGRMAIIYSNGYDVYYQRLEGGPGAAEVVYTSSTYSPGIKGYGFFGGEAYPHLAFFGPEYTKIHFATKTSSVWDVITHYISDGDKSESTATDGGTPANPYLIQADDLSGEVYLVRPQVSEYTTIIPQPNGQGLSASATSPDGIPTILQVMGDELYVFTPGEDEWVGQSTGLFPVFDYMSVRELCDLAFLADGRMVIAYWNGDEKSFHIAIGAPGNWQDTEIILPTKDRAIDVALAVNSGNYPGLAVTFDKKDVYYIENIPEPATLSLLMIGGLVMLRRKK